jgi:hypothetical protein
VGLEDWKDLVDDLRQALEVTKTEVAGKEVSGEFERFDLWSNKFISKSKM